MSSVADLGVLVETLQDLPAPVAVLGVLGDAVQVEETLHRLRAQEVVSVSRLGEGRGMRSHVQGPHHHTVCV